jgi:hypothetical protein
MSKQSFVSMYHVSIDNILVQICEEYYSIKEMIYN